MVLQIAWWESPYFGIEQNYSQCAKVGTFPPSYAVVPSFISCFTTFYYIDPYLIFKLTILKILVLVFYYSTASYSL